ncbi:MAG: MBL fold metallo-hydrolase, partial [Candidatus Bathyarchaeia archaeon]
MSKIKSLKVTTIVENLIQTGGLLGEWGLSFLLEVEDERGRVCKIVSDTGSSREAILHNIKRLKLDLSDLEYIFLSHGHGDHTAATAEILKLAGGGVKVVSHPYLFLPRFYIDRTGRRRPGGIPEGERIEEIETAGGEIIQSAEPLEILPGLWTTGQIPRTTDFEVVGRSTGGSRRVIIVEDEGIPDQILDDQALWMDVEGVGPMVITGCAHSGIVNTLLHVKKLGDFKGIHGVIG